MKRQSSTLSLKILSICFVAALLTLSGLILKKQNAGSPAPVA